MSRYAPGQIISADLTVDNAEEVRNFYSSVVGWRANELEMGGYADYVMSSADGVPCAGICHARGANADLPPQWIVYVIVEDLGASIEACIRGGGSLVGEVRGGEGPRFAILRDPVGAAIGIMENPDGDGEPAQD